MANKTQPIEHPAFKVKARYRKDQGSDLKNKTVKVNAFDITSGLRLADKLLGTYSLWNWEIISIRKIG